MGREMRKNVDIEERFENKTHALKKDNEKVLFVHTKMRIETFLQLYANR